MRYMKCCVPGCNNKREGTMLLHKFPVCAKRRKVWLNSINCPSLRVMKTYELCKQCVCHKHFEARFLTQKSRLTMQAYPTLFTEKEISSGIPTNPESEVHDPSSEHKYCQTKHEDHNYVATRSKESAPLEPKLADLNININQEETLYLSDLDLGPVSAPSSPELDLDININQQKTQYLSDLEAESAPIRPKFEDLDININQQETLYVSDLEADPEHPTLEYVILEVHDLTPVTVTDLEFQMDTENLTPIMQEPFKEYRKKMLEVCVDSLESAINAIHGGADELEVCSSLTEAGLTPSPGLVKQIREMVDNLSKNKPIRKSCNKCACNSLTKVPKVNVMIRCRTGSDFQYSKEEMDTMLYDIDIFKDGGVDRFVFGALTDTQDIDEINCTKIMHRAHPIPVTFHRAFDVCKDPKNAILKIIELGFDRLLTSGQKPAANDEGAIELLKSLIENHGDKIQIMPGAGITLGNVNTFIDIGCNIVHSSCKCIRYLPQIKDSISMGITDGEYIYVTVEDIVRKMKSVLSGEAIVS